jgi:F420H(2)-dependent quinone reductase
VSGVDGETSARIARLEGALSALAEEVTRLRDVAEIHAVLASYGPAVDSDSADLAGDIWTEDGVYDIDGWELTGRAAIREMLASEVHQPYVRSGSSHLVSTPVVHVDGDTATAVSFMSLISRTGDGDYRIGRQTANLWDLRRTPAGWRVRRRTNRLLDGSTPARDLLRAGFLDTHRTSGAYAPSSREGVRDQVALFESSGGVEGATMHGLPVVVLSTHGRRSGQVRKSPVMRVEHDGEYAVVASLGGRPDNPAWFDNLVTHPLVGLQDAGVRRPYRARVLEGAEREVWWARAVEAFPTYAEYQERTTRRIPVVLLTAV